MSACYTYVTAAFKESNADQTHICNLSLSCLFTQRQLTLTHVGSICVILCPFVVSHQVGEIEEQLAAARREVTKSEEANQKLQREVKEVCRANLSHPGPKLPQLLGI